MGSPTHCGIKLQYIYLVMSLRKGSTQRRTQPSMYRNKTRNSIRVCGHFYSYFNEYNVVDRLMYCNKSHTTPKAKAHLRPHTQVLILPALRMQTVGTRDTSAPKPIFTRCRLQKEKKKTIEHLGHLKKVDTNDLYCRCCAGTYFRKGLRRTTQFLAEYLTPRKRMEPSTPQLLLQTCYHYTNLSASFDA